jgi:hypothetical protein
MHTPTLCPVVQKKIKLLHCNLSLIKYILALYLPQLGPVNLTPSWARLFKGNFVNNLALNLSWRYLIQLSSDDLTHWTRLFKGNFVNNLALNLSWRYLLQLSPVDLTHWARLFKGNFVNNLALSPPVDLTPR